MSSSASDLVLRAPWPSRARAYLDLTRPGVLLGVLLTALPAFALGQVARADAHVVLAVLAGIALVGAGSSALNAWWEADADARMARTRGRPLPSGRLSPGRALAFGLASSALGLAALQLAAGGLAAAIGAATLLHYLLVYTVWLKPRSAWNTVVGALAGCTAPLIADAADGRVGAVGLALAAIVFVWQPPHVFAIALYRREEYAAASFRMLPVVVGERATRCFMLAFALALFPVSLVPFALGVVGRGYALVAVALCSAFALSIVAALRARSSVADRRVFLVSLLALAGLFGAMILEIAWSF
jgi:protoheme IX farnesyltransferase